MNIRIFATKEGCMQNWIILKQISKRKSTKKVHNMIQKNILKYLNVIIKVEGGSDHRMAAGKATKQKKKQIIHSA